MKPITYALEKSVKINKPVARLKKKKKKWNTNYQHQESE
jgi:hypothetical protein